MKREAVTKGVLENPVDENEKSQNLQINRRPVHVVNNTFENYKEENPVAEGEKKLHKSHINRRTVDSFKEAFEN